MATPLVAPVLCPPLEPLPDELLLLSLPPQAATKRAVDATSAAAKPLRTYMWVLLLRSPGDGRSDVVGRLLLKALRETDVPVAGASGTRARRTLLRRSRTCVSIVTRGRVRTVVRGGRGEQRDGPAQRRLGQPRVAEEQRAGPRRR